MNPHHLDVQDRFIRAVNDAAAMDRPVTVIEDIFRQFCQTASDKEREELDMLRFMLKSEHPIYRLQYAALDMLVADPSFSHIPPNRLARILGRCGGWVESRNYLESNHLKDLPRWGARSGEIRFPDEQQAVIEVYAIYKKIVLKGKQAYVLATGRPDYLEIPENQVERLAEEIYQLFVQDLKKNGHL